MKSFKTIFRTALAAMAAMAAFACQEGLEDLGMKETLNEDLTLSVDVEDVTYTTAKVKVTHDGNKNDTWYGFLTEYVDLEEDVLIELEVKAFAEGQSEEGLRKSKSWVKILDDLKPGKSYKYIVFGLSAEGTVYGSYASVEFKTVVSSSGGNDEGAGDGGNGNNNEGATDATYMRRNPNWTVTYGGEGVIDGEKYDHVVSVNSKDNNTYAITLINASLWDESLLLEDSKAFAADLVAYLGEYNQAYGGNLTLEDVLFRGTCMDAFDIYYPGYYVAVAIGITTNGKVSGLYAVSDTFEVKEEIPTEKYNAWLGDWTIVGDNKKEFQVNISRALNNRSFWMSGWEGFGEEFAMLVDYNEERDDLTFYSQVIAKDYQIEDMGTCNIYLLGLDEDGDTYNLSGGEYGIAIAGILETGRRAVVRYGYGEQGYPTFASMLYVAEIGGELFRFTDNDEDLPSFKGIAEMNPVEQAAVKSMAGRQKPARVHEPKSLTKGYNCLLTR